MTLIKNKANLYIVHRQTDGIVGKYGSFRPWAIRSTVSCTCKQNEQITGRYFL